MYVPGHRAEAIEQARHSVADVVCLDLEDNVPPEAKAQARALVAGAVRQGCFRAIELIVRINSPRTDEFAFDSAALADVAVDGLLVPKVRNAEEIETLRRAFGGHPPALWCMIEDAQGLLCCANIAAAADVTALVVGSGDLASSLRLPPPDACVGLRLHGAQIVVAARAAGITAIEGFVLDGDQANPCGFDGRSSFLGQDIADVNRRFSPSEAEVENARSALKRPYAYGDHLTAAEGVIRRARQIAERDALLVTHGS
nr:aldolase/citrate lyase family protein [Sphingobium sp. OAS761]